MTKTKAARTPVKKDRVQVGWRIKRRAHAAIEKAARKRGQTTGVAAARVIEEVIERGIVDELLDGAEKRLV